MFEYSIWAVGRIFLLDDQLKKRITKPKICDSLNNGVLVLISGWLINDRKTGPPPSALMGLDMIVES